MSGLQTKDERDGGTVNRPAYSGRVVRAFDFEEMYTNPLPIPRGWIRAQHDPEVPRDRPGFPIWNGARLDYSSPAFSGKGTAHLPTAGGSTSLILRHGELTVFPNADYMITARVRTEGLSHARARMVATLIDRAGNVIEDETVSTRLVRTRGEWEQISMFIEGANPETAFVQVELQLLQPEQQPRSRMVKPFTVWSQDFEGGAWFDDVVIAQVPMIGLDTGTPGNVVVGDDAPVLNMKVRDLTGDDLGSYIRVFDASGVMVDEHAFEGRVGGGDLGEGWSPELPGYGWYHAVFDVLSGRGAERHLVGRKELDFIWGPARSSGDSIVGGEGAEHVGPRDSSFALRTKSMNSHLLEALPELVGMTGVRHVEMRVWDSDSVRDDLLKGSELVDAIDRVVSLGAEVGLSLSEVPMELADQAAIDQDSIFALLMEHEPIALPVLGPFLDRYGQQVSDWRIGSHAAEDDAARLVEQTRTVREMMDPYVPGAVVGVSWAMDRPFEGAVLSSPVRLLVEDDASFPDDAMGDLMDQWVQAGRETSGDGVSSGGGSVEARLSVVHEPYGMGDSGNESVWSRVGWLGRRAINSWWAGKGIGSGSEDVQIVLSDPWVIEGGRRGRVMPGPELLVWRTLVDHLGGRDAVSELELRPGVRMLLCSGRSGAAPIGYEDSIAIGSSGKGDASGDGALVVWLDEPGLERVTVELPLAMGAVRVVDLFGNARDVGLEYETELDLPVHRIEITRTPQIITGVNAALVEFLASIRLSPDRFEATSGVHKHELVIHNPWPFSIRGRVYIVEPGGYSEPGSTRVDRSWEMKPRVVNFTVTGGLEERVPIDISYSSAKLAGMKDLIFDVELVADQEYSLMRVKRQIELGTDQIDVTLAIRGGELSSGVIEVEAFVTNQTDVPMYADVVAIAPKNPRQESSISVIDPMKDARRSFVFDSMERGDEVIVSVRIPDRGLQINKAISVP
ncbi:MAG: hypothetical protein JJ974_04695 [Phycisphaerales bacterium]|nr:hypothetical protein [Phycisphaerales bacterium]